MAERTKRARRAGAAASNGKRTGVIDAPPDVLGDGGRAQVLAEVLFDAARQVFRYEAIRIANGHGMDDPVAGLPATQPDGTVNSYRVVTAAAREQEQRLAAEFPELIERVRELVAQRQQLEARR